MPPNDCINYTAKEQQLLQVHISKKKLEDGRTYAVKRILSQIGFHVSCKKKNDHALALLSNVTDIFLQSFMERMHHHQDSEIFCKSPDSWNSLETTLQEYGFGGIHGLEKYFYGEFVKTHDSEYYNRKRLKKEERKKKAEMRRARKCKKDAINTLIARKSKARKCKQGRLNNHIVKKSKVEKCKKDEINNCVAKEKKVEKCKKDELNKCVAKEKVEKCKKDELYNCAAKKRKVEKCKKDELNKCVSEEKKGEKCKKDENNCAAKKRKVENCLGGYAMVFENSRVMT